MQAQAAKSKLWEFPIKVRITVEGGDRERIVFPLQPMTFMRAAEGTGDLEAVDGQFGLVPSWVTQEHGGAKFGRHCFNARTETVFEKPSFRKAIVATRAAVPVDCFFEFPDKEVPLQHRFKIRTKDGSGFWLAAIWERNQGLKMDSVSVLTTEPMELLAQFHSRSPVILDEGQVQAWLDPGLRRAAEIKKMFRPHDSSDFELVTETWGGERRQGDLF